MKNRPSMGLHQAVCRANSAEWILFALAADKSAGLTASTSNDTVANENGHTVSLALDYVPDLSNSCEAGNPMGERGSALEVKRVPPLWGKWADVLKTMPRSEITHFSPTEPVHDLHPAGDQQNYSEYFEYIHVGYSASSA